MWDSVHAYQICSSMIEPTLFLHEMFKTAVVSAAAGTGIYQFHSLLSTSNSPSSLRIPSSWVFTSPAMAMADTKLPWSPLSLLSCRSSWCRRGSSPEGCNMSRWDLTIMYSSWPWRVGSNQSGELSLMSPRSSPVVFASWALCVCATLILAANPRILTDKG